MTAARIARGATGALALVLFAHTSAFADCDADIRNLTAKRQTFIDKLNTLAKATKGKLDPVASCPTLRGLVKAEGELIKYLQANKDWCNIPDQAVENLKTADEKSNSFASKACQLAAQVKQQQKQAAASGGSSLGIDAQKLPAGPL